MMKLVLVVSFLALAAALPYQRDNIVGKGSSQGDPFKLIFGAIAYLKQDIDVLNQRVGVLENQVGAIESHQSKESEEEPIPDGSGQEVAAVVEQEPVRSDETAVRMLLQKLESRLVEKKREQKQAK
ncbi:hypothetical protein CHS0354_014870 [Potamilus streckersoni]|uniref:Uncharacterized protein n=1 Tax=Potamilus streckersoni TaxID=2493646 RepID=A0AAE0VE77_9BIVA|nr:hypothetical protein CHS0354_014870 [Potamilus streckersoni]